MFASTFFYPNEPNVDLLYEGVCVMSLTSELKVQHRGQSHMLNLKVYSSIYMNMPSIFSVKKIMKYPSIDFRLHYHLINAN